MSARLSIVEFTAQAQALRDGALDDYVAAHALFALVKSMADSAQELRDRLSEDQYVQRGMGAWDADMKRLRNQLAHVMTPTLEQREGPHLPDVILPILEGVWPLYLGSLPQYKDGVQPGDLVLPPTATAAESGSASFKTMPVVSAVVILWNGAMVAVDHDASAGDDWPSRAIKKSVTRAATYFESRAPGDPEGATLWTDTIKMFNRMGELAGDAGSNLWDGATSGFGKVLGYTAGGLLALWGIKQIISR